MCMMRMRCVHVYPQIRATVYVSGSESNSDVRLHPLSSPFSEAWSLLFAAVLCTPG